MDIVVLKGRLLYIIQPAVPLHSNGFGKNLLAWSRIGFLYYGAGCHELFGGLLYPIAPAGREYIAFLISRGSAATTVVMPPLLAS